MKSPNQAQETNRRGQSPLGLGQRFICAANALVLVFLLAVAQFTVGRERLAP